MTTPFRYEMVAPNKALEGWRISRQLLAPVVESGRMDEEYLLKEIERGEVALVHIFNEKGLAGATAYSIGVLDGRSVLRIHLLAGEFPTSWMAYLQLFFDCIAKAAGANYIEFFTRHRAERVMTKFGYEEIGTLYRRPSNGIEKFVANATRN